MNETDLMIEGLGELEEYESTIAYVLRNLEDTFDDFKVKPDTIEIWSRSLKSLNTKAMKDAVDEWVMTKEKKPVLAEFRTFVLRKCPKSTSRKDRQFSEWVDKQGRTHVSLN